MSARAAIIGLSGALALALGFIGWSEWRAVPLSYPGDQVLIDRTTVRARKVTETRPSVSPVVMHLGDLVCVELRTRSRLRDGNYSACYDRSGKLVSESETAI